MTYSEQAIALARQAILRHPGDGAVGDAATDVNAAVLDDSAVLLAWGNESCDEWRAHPGEWSLGPGAYNLNQGHYALACRDWEDAVEASLRVLEDALRRAGDAEMADAAAAGAEQAATASEQAAATFDFSFGTLWLNTPPLVKGLFVIGGAILIFQATDALR